MPRTRTWQGSLAAGLWLAVSSSPSTLLAKPDDKRLPPATAGQEPAKPDGKTVPPAAATPLPKPATSGTSVAAPSVDSQSKVVAAESGTQLAAGVEPAAESVEAEPAGAKAQPKLSAEQLAALRDESSQLIDEMAQARAKAALLGKTLFKTQLRLRVQNLAAPDPRLVKIELKLDGAPVFVGDGTTLSGDDARQVFEGFIAPGRHVLTAEVKQQSREDATFGYNLHDSYHFKVQRDKLSELTLIVDDDSDMASDYPDDGDGEYDVRLKLRVRTKNIGEE
jgi:hypothetical protein